MIKGLTYQGNLIILHIYASNHVNKKYVKQKLTELKGEQNKFIIIFHKYIWRFDTPFSIIVRISTEEINKSVEELTQATYLM